MKQEFKEQNCGKHGSRWFNTAIDEYHRRVAKHFPNLQSNDRGLVLVQCTQQVVDSGRVVEPFSYGYEGKKALYGPAQVPEAIQFFFKNKDPPVLEKEMQKYREGLRLMRKNKKERLPALMMDEFESLLDFVDEKIRVPNENIMAKVMLKRIKFLPVPKKLGKLLRENIQPVAQQAAIETQCPADTAVTEHERLFAEPKKDTTSSPAETDTVTLSMKSSLPWARWDQVDVYTGLRDDDGSIHNIGTNQGELLPIDASNTDETTNTILQDLVGVPDFEPLPFNGSDDTLDQQVSREDEDTSEPNEYDRTSFQSQPMDKRELMIDSLLKEQDNLKGQINYLQDLLEQLILDTPSENGSRKSRSRGKSNGQVREDEKDSFTRCAVERHDSRSVVSGRQRARRTSRKSSGRNRQQRSSSISSKRSRQKEDIASVTSELTHKDIETQSDSQDDDEDEEDAESYESYDSKGLRDTQGHAGRSTHSSSSRSGHRSLPSRKDSGNSNFSSTLREVSVTHVSDQRLTDSFGESGVCTGIVTVSDGVPHGHGRFDYDKEGCFYEGEWRDGRWHGQGHLGNGAGDVYNGCLERDLKHGMGTMDFADGRRFQGQYVFGEMREGTMTYPDGNSYKGQWRRGLPHGQGQTLDTRDYFGMGDPCDARSNSRLAPSMAKARVALLTYHGTKARFGQA
eukprot:scaffold2768_cov161-Amphora_coffeaeformis.AAC.9